MLSTIRLISIYRNRPAKMTTYDKAWKKLTVLFNKRATRIGPHGSE